jgi:DNA-binding NtrC family response regulator
MKILFTFTGFHDPYTIGLVGEEELSGPILSLVNEVVFDRVILFSTPRTDKHTRLTKDALRSLHPALTVETLEMPLDDPTDYPLILRGLRDHFRQVSHTFPDGDFYISVASGTPQMHACWLLLVASGEMPAHILHIRPPRFVTGERPLISEIDLTSPDFPVVKPNIFSDIVTDIIHPDLDTAVKEIGIVGDHLSMKKAIEIAATLAPTDVPMLILGETGTGKELFAKLIHRLSNRQGYPFIPINCAAIPKELVESILFGHKKGAFTGATSDQAGKFDAVHKGTLFLDELAELPVSTQSKLLRVLQDGMVEPLGSAKPHKVDVRVIAATNQDIKEAIKTGKFRQDLYYRLNVGEIRLPPLRERKSDIPKIALYALERINHSLKNKKRLSIDALSKLQDYPWHGNARELENAIERSVRLSKKDVLDAGDILIDDVPDCRLPAAMPEPQAGFSIEEYLSTSRKALINKAMELAGGNRSKAARLLGISPQAVHKFLKTVQNDEAGN